MTSPESSQTKTTLWSLWRQFLPLSLSDVTMAFGDPMITTTLAHLPHARVNLAAVGVAKASAVFFESPIIMLLHASNALAPTAKSRQALWRFAIIVCSLLTLLVSVLALPWVFQVVGGKLLGVEPEIFETARTVLLLLMLWPLAIGWRRYYQGLLIYGGHAKSVARAGIGRLIVVAGVLAGGLAADINGAVLAGVALITGVLAEALMVTVSAKRLGATRPPEKTKSPSLPDNIPGVWRFYWPLASSMLVVWGGRALLIGVIARAEDSSLALAAWPAAWGFVLVIANATRMVQQVVIRNREHTESRLLLWFALSVGLVCSAFLLTVGVTPIGHTIIAAFIGNDPALASSMLPVVLLCSAVPLFIALQNATQGFLIGEGRTQRINVATWIGTSVLLISAYIAVLAGMPGATAAALAVLLALATETAWLGFGLNLRSLLHEVSEKTPANLKIAAPKTASER